MLAKFKQFEVAYGIRRPRGQSCTELISVTLAAEVRADNDTELEEEVHKAFMHAKKLVANER